MKKIEYTKEDFATVVQWLQKQPLPTFRQSKEKHNDSSKIALSLFRNIQDKKSS